MSHIPHYIPSNFGTPDTGFHNDGLWIRPGIIQGVDADTGLLDVEWMDHPGIRQGIAITQPHQGMFQIPTVGSIVLVGFDQGFGAQILRYLPAGYAAQVEDRDLYPLRPGEITLFSFQDTKGTVREKQFIVPTTTGTRFFMNNIGDIQMATALGEWWHMSNAESEIRQNSMNYTVSTEAGVMQFGLTRRLPESSKSEENVPSIITPNGQRLEDVGGLNPEGLTEFRLRLLETADTQQSALNDPNAYVPAVNDPFIELTLGVKVDDDGDLVKTTAAQAKTTTGTQDIIIQLKTRTDQGFEFTVDREGNVTLLVKGNIKIDVGGDTDLTVAGNVNANVNGDIVAEAKKIKLTGDKALVLADFLTSYDTHTHVSAAPGSPTAPPLVSSLPTHKSKKVTVS